jgi:Polyketide cyclase / dehydrase and lipid transport
MALDLNNQGRASVSRKVEAPASAVWSTLSDGWLYASWVVGTSRVREVDLSWPDVGSRIHHSFGLWPALANDETIVLESVPPRLLQLQAKGWPLGEARVELRINEIGAQRCEVSILEDAVKGPGTLLPRPARQPLIAARNREALRRLAMLAEGRYRAGLSRR